jgi:betaine-aldehyde dehydrogenase
MVSITGSVGAGMAVATAAAADLKVSHLELGGKAPVIVFDDADLAATVSGIRDAGFFNAGQDCTAATRVLCQSGVYDEFVTELGKAAAETRTGFDAADEDIFYGPINNANQLRHISGLVDRAPEHARVVTGGQRVGDRGYFYAPTVIADLAQTDELITTEVFGPVITVQRFSDEDDAVMKANDTAYGLSSSVWTTDAGTAARVSARLDFGCVWINTHIPLVAEMPHGGFKHSGYGKDLSAYGLEDYTRIKHVMQYHGFEG